MDGLDDPGLTAADRELMRAAQTGEGLIPVGPQELLALGRAAREVFDEASDDFAGMTAEQAAFVRRLRLDDGDGLGYSWRAVAETCHLEWQGTWEPPSNQLVGMAICKRAAELHGENYMEEPWN